MHFSVFSASETIGTADIWKQKRLPILVSLLKKPGQKNGKLGIYVFFHLQKKLLFPKVWKAEFLRKNLGLYGINNEKVRKLNITKRNIKLKKQTV